MESKKQTAVEWFCNESESLRVNAEINNMDAAKFLIRKAEIFQQAKEMEKEQIMKHSLELAKILISNPYERSGKMPTELAQTYYNETFKSE